MNIVAFEMIALGMDDNEIHKWSSDLQSGRYSPETTQYHIDLIRSKMAKGDLFPHGCGAIKRAGFCVHEEAPGLDECRVAEKSYEESQLVKQISDLQSGTSDISLADM